MGVDYIPVVLLIAQKSSPQRRTLSPQIVKYLQRIVFEVDEVNPSSASTPPRHSAIDVVLCFQTITRKEIRVIEVFVEYVES
mmetsp:Transcript_20789/g.20546  ORF Transcript_20789/g.20546 Transcript_20789/m.20546 type:complete len:82 (+) Transcript_20789:371-616(+)